MQMHFVLNIYKEKSLHFDVVEIYYQMIRRNLRILHLEKQYNNKGNLRQKEKFFF